MEQTNTCKCHSDTVFLSLIHILGFIGLCGNLTFNAAKIPFDDLYFIPYSKGFAIKTDSIGIQDVYKRQVQNLSG